MSKFKVGDKVVGNMLPNDKGVLYLHTYLTQNKVYYVEKVESGLVVVTADDGVTSYWSEDWFKLYEEKGTEMTAERIREDILHIEKRIEEAKKDITSMEQEKNALIEKLREKGFTLTGEISRTDSDKPFLEIGAAYVVNDSEEASTYFRAGTKVKLLDIDVRDTAFNVKVENDVGDKDWMNSTGLTKI
jgi:hypothetical protein